MTDTQPNQPTDLFARIDDDHWYRLTGDLIRYDGIPIAAIVTDQDGGQHLAMLTDEAPATLHYVLAQVDADTVAAMPTIWTDSGRVRNIMLASPRVARLQQTFDGSGACVDTETVVPAADLTDAELPLR